LHHAGEERKVSIKLQWAPQFM